MHQGSLPSLVLVDQVGMGLCPRQFWVGIGSVPRGVASRPCLGTRSLPGVQFEAEPGVACMLTLVLGVKASTRGRVCHLGNDDRVVLMCAELDEQSAQRCKT